MSSIALTILNGPEAGKVFKLRAGQEMTIGREDTSDAALPRDPMMSRVHFEFGWGVNGAYLKDLGSTNRTFVNQRRVEKRYLVETDTIQAGATRFKVTIESTRAFVLGQPSVRPDDNDGLKRTTSWNLVS